MTPCDQPLTLGETTLVRLPAYWASSLINGDDSGIDENEIQQIDETLEHLGLEAMSCCSMEDEAEFELRPSYLPWLKDGAYATFSFV